MGLCGAPAGGRIRDMRMSLGISFLAVASAWAQPVSWTTVRDTREDAFSVDVPKGWKVEGGLLRKGPLDPRAEVEMTSPDGRVNMRVGDWGVPPFTVPTGQMERLGFTEGKEYAPGNPPTATTVARYRNGQDFAAAYGAARFSKVCQTLEAKSLKSMDPIFRAPREGAMTTTAGETIYRCLRNGQENVAYVYAETGLYQANGVANWTASAVLSFVAPKDQAGTIYRILFQSAASFTPNPQWQLRQQRITAANAAEALKTFHLTLQQTEARYQQWSKSMARQGQSFSDVLNGRTLTLDTATGQQREVWTGTGSTRWINGLGEVVSSNLSPGPSFRALQDVGR
jgi:hypothetical protein